MDILPPGSKIGMNRTIAVSFSSEEEHLITSLLQGSSQPRHERRNSARDWRGIRSEEANPGHERPPTYQNDWPCTSKTLNDAVYVCEMNGEA